MLIANKIIILIEFSFVCELLFETA